MSCSSVRPPTATLTPVRSMTVLPSRAAASLDSSTPSRGAGSPEISAVAASILNLGLLVLAGGPRRSQASSLRSRLRLRWSCAAACLARSALAST